MENKPNQGSCNPHSWSNKGKWEACCYPREKECMTNNPFKVANFKCSLAAENLATSYLVKGEGPIPTIWPEKTLEGWKKSRGHNIVIINEGWAKQYQWKSLGVAIYRNWASMWVAPEVDPLGKPDCCLECNKLSNNKLKNECNVLQGIFDQNNKFCENITDKASKEECYDRIIFSQCDKMTNESQRDQCILKLEENNPDLCSHLFKKEDEQSQCYLYIAAKKKDLSICNKINNISEKENCRQLIISGKYIIK